MSTTPSAEPRLSALQLGGFGIAAMPAQFMYVLILILYLQFATDELGVSGAAVGTIFLIAKIWDAISDPLVGTLSDRTVTAIGRRRSWLFASAPAVALFGLMAWSPPESLEGVGLLAWITFSVIGFYTAYTCFEVPHMSLGAEITLDSQERSRVFSVRQVARTLGMFAFAMSVATFQGGRESAANAAMIFAVVAVVLIIGGIWVTPPERPSFMGRAGENPVKALQDVARNPHARILLFVFFVESIGSGGIGVLTPYVIEHILLMPDITGPMLGWHMICSLLGVPLWLWLGKSYEKRRLWLVAMIMGGVGYGILFFIGEGSWMLMAVSSLIAGAAGSCGNTLGYALKSEVIDYDEYLTGDRKEGAYFAGWSFVSKLAGGIMVFVVGVMLDWIGYVPNVEQGEGVKSAMLFMIGGIPLIGYSIGSLVFSRYQFSEARHAEIRAELDARAAAGAEGR